MMSKKINRRTFIKAALTTGIALGGGLILGCENTPATSNELKVKFLRQIITKDSTTSRCIMWQTDSPMTEPIVEITVGDEVKKISASPLYYENLCRKIDHKSGRCNTVRVLRGRICLLTGSYFALICQLTTFLADDSAVQTMYKYE